MQITLKSKSKHLELTDALKDYAQKKLARLEKHFDHLLSADVTLSTERNFHVVEVTVHANGTTLRGTEKTGDMYSSIDQVIDKLERQVQKYKEKLHDHHRIKEEGEAAVAVIPRARIMMKRQRVLPLTPEDAADEMRKLGHAFYVFQNRDTEEINIIYRRENGNSGVIEPQL